VLIYFFVCFVHANTLLTPLCVFEQSFFWSLFTLEVQIIFNIEFHQFKFHFSNVSHPCDHFGHPTLNVWTMYFTSFFCASPYFIGPHRSQYWVSSNVLIWFFVCFFHANTLRTSLCVFEQICFVPFRTLVPSIFFINEFHQLWFSYFNSPRSCDHFAHPTLCVWPKIFTSFFCASPNFRALHRSQYWVSSCVLICFFVGPIETYKNNGWFFL
jgi:hypothetical protein